MIHLVSFQLSPTGPIGMIWGPVAWWQWWTSKNIRGSPDSSGYHIYSLHHLLDERSLCRDPKNGGYSAFFHPVSAWEKKSHLEGPWEKWSIVFAVPCDLPLWATHFEDSYELKSPTTAIDYLKITSVSAWGEYLCSYSTTSTMFFFSRILWKWSLGFVNIYF